MRAELELKSRISLMKVCLLITMLLTGIVPSSSARKSNSQRKITAASDTDNQRSLMLGNLLLVPILASLGMKLLAFLPIVLTKLLLLTTLSFLSSNLSLLISVFVGVRNFWLLEQKANLHGHDDEYLHHHDHAAVKHEAQEDPGKKEQPVNLPSSRLDRWPVGPKYAEWRRRYLRRAIDAKKKLLLTGKGLPTPGPSQRDPLTGRRKTELRYPNRWHASFL
ncbi:uncharacterized protein LOC112493730 [Cephus cinctus]|uniref:Uncharacterized protein LOC112493730 n=1 Tax=Cephus cinctus TaxID=211228 RepID=A0AAJ7R8K7_CEPCN|nr:uncharacterized protein LOC112493730 [Cephus cinctus]